MAIATTRIPDFINHNLKQRYRYLGLVLDYISYSPNVHSGGYTLTLKYKDDRYEMINLMDVREVTKILEEKNLELQPNRGYRASKYHI